MVTHCKRYIQQVPFLDNCSSHWCNCTTVFPDNHLCVPTNRPVHILLQFPLPWGSPYSTTYFMPNSDSICKDSIYIILFPKRVASLRHQQQVTWADQATWSSKYLFIESTPSLRQQMMAALANTSSIGSVGRMNELTWSTKHYSASIIYNAQCFCIPKIMPTDSGRAYPRVACSLSFQLEWNMVSILMN